VRALALVTFTILLAACNNAAGEQAAAHVRSGLLFYYAYNPSAAFREFKTAAQLDRRSPMAWWGLALSKTSNLNVPATPERLRLAQQAIINARRLEAAASPKERAFIDALSARLLPAANFEHLDAYVDAAGRVARAYPDDSTAQVLYGEALLEHGDYKAAFALLSRAARTFDDVGSAHFLIHAAEMAGAPHAADRAAARLANANLPDAASHLLHMAAHVYVDESRWSDAAAASTRAVAMDDRELARGHRSAYDSDRYYYQHTLDFALYALLRAGRAGSALRLAAREHNKDGIAEMLLATKQFAAIENMPVYDSVPSLFVHTVAAAHRGEKAAAARYRQRLTRLPQLVPFVDDVIRVELTRRTGKPLHIRVSQPKYGDLPVFFYY
jgi:tetratricopeptide (TPR) repeat protein